MPRSLALLATLHGRLAALALAACLLLGSAPARAQTARPDFWITNGSVNAAVLRAGTLYIGGSFTRVGPVTGGAVPLDATTGAVGAGYPQLNGVVNAVVADGAGGWYLGGQFTTVGGSPRANLAHLLADQSLDPAWNPGTDGTVDALALGAGVLYVGGNFANAGGQARANLAAIDSLSGAATAWNPGAGGEVDAFVLAGGTLYAGGAFGTLGGATRGHLGAVDVASGVATAFDPGADLDVVALALAGGVIVTGGDFTSIGGATRLHVAAIDTATALATAWNPGANGAVDALAAGSGVVYAGGAFTSIGGASRNHVAALDLSSGLATAWDANADAPVQALALAGGTLYAGGDFLAVGGQARSRLAAIDATSGATLAWDPGAFAGVFALAASGNVVEAGGSFGGVGGLQRGSLAALDVASGAATSFAPAFDGSVYALDSSAGLLYVGGSFAHAGGFPRADLAAVDVLNGQVTGWNPGADGTVSALAAAGPVVYAGGAFNNAGGAARNYIAALDSASALATTWNPHADDQVFDLHVDGNLVFAGGGFSSVGGQARLGIAAIDRTSGLATNWNPGANGTVREIALGCGTIYLGGFFTMTGGTMRNYIAAIDRTSGLATSWNPNASGPVLHLLPAGGVIYAGGVLNSIGGQPRNRLAALDPVTGLATAWNPGAGGPVRILAGGFGGAVYVGGSFGSMGASQQSNLAALPADAGASCPVIALTPASLPYAVAATTYAQGLAASGGSGPYCWAVTAGALPAGLALDPASGALSGTPTAAGSAAFTVTATDARGCSGSTSYTLSVFSGAATSTIAASTTGLVVNGTHPSVSVPFVYTRTDSGTANGASVTFRLDTAHLSLVTPATPAASVHLGSFFGSPSTAMLQVTSIGGGAYTVDCASLAQPCGIAGGGALFTVDVTAAAGDGSGTLAVTALRVRDCANSALAVVPGATATLPIENTPVVLAPSSLPAGTAGLAYATQTLTAGPGTAPFAFHVTSGALPAGLALATGGTLSGTPVATGTFAFTVTATDAYGTAGTRAYSIAVSCPPLAVAPVAIPSGVVGSPYTQSFTLAGALLPAHWSVSSGTLPAGLALDPATGQLAGTPSALGTSVFTVLGTDSAGCNASRSYTVTTFAGPVGSTVAANTAGLCLSHTHTLASVPFRFVRTDTEPVRGFSVTFQLDLAHLALATPSNPAASLHTGSLFGPYGMTITQATDDGAGTYTLDIAILGSPCGPDTGGVVFTADVVASGPDGAGAISVQSVKVRGCANDPIAALPGPVATLVVNSTAPAALADLAASALPAGNGTGSTFGVQLTWSGAVGDVVTLYRAPYGTYPDYAEPPAVAPDSSLAPGAPWTLVASGVTSGYVDRTAPRGFWYYVATVADSCGNVSGPGNRTHGTLDYLLGDVSDGYTPGTGNNTVGFEDISLLGANYGIGESDLTARHVEYLDVGPTTDLAVTSRPLCDQQVDFEDLIVFATNFRRTVAGPAMARLADLAGAAASAPESFRLEAPALVEPGTVVTATLHLAAAGRLQGFAARLRWDPDVVEPLDVTPGHFVADQGGLVLSPGPGRVDAALLGIREHGIAGAGEVATLRFRVRRAGDAAIALAEVTARDAANRPLAPGALASATAAAAPLATVLLATGPNPFHGSAPLLYSLAHAGPVQLDVFAVDGRRVRALAGGVQPAGVVHLAWDGRDDHGDRVGPGVYYVHMAAGGLHFTRKLVFLR